MKKWQKEMNEVSSCCGCDYEDSFISDCCSMEVYTDTDICSACKEHTDTTGYICNECGNWFEYLEDKKEYEDRMYENYLEDRADARRKYGE